jgi:hypothetical protein
VVLVGSNANKEVKLKLIFSQGNRRDLGEGYEADGSPTHYLLLNRTEKVILAHLTLDTENSEQVRNTNFIFK